MTYDKATIEFPDYPAADLPPMPEGFSDSSWHNDTCPSITNGSLIVFIDYLDPAERELPCLRFSVQKIEGDCSPVEVKATDSWAEIEAFIAKETVETLDSMFESEAQRVRDQAKRADADPVLQAKIAAKRKREAEAAAAGRTVYTPAEIAAHEAEEIEEEGSDR